TSAPDHPNFQPRPKPSDSESRASLGRWGQMFLSSLKKNDPAQNEGLEAESRVGTELYRRCSGAWLTCQRQGIRRARKWTRGALCVVCGRRCSRRPKWTPDVHALVVADDAADHRPQHRAFEAK